jgi:hypothetical protein
MKLIHLIFYGTDGDAAKAAAVAARKEKSVTAMVRHAQAFAGEAEPADRVVLLPCVTLFDAGRIRATYGERVANAGSALPPLPPVPVVNPLDNLAADWRSRDDLKSLAASVSGGRAVENKRQAIEVIEAALKARAAQ